MDPVPRCERELDERTKRPMRGRLDAHCRAHGELPVGQVGFVMGNISKTAKNNTTKETEMATATGMVEAKRIGEIPEAMSRIDIELNTLAETVKLARGKFCPALRQAPANRDKEPVGQSDAMSPLGLELGAFESRIKEARMIVADMILDSEL